MAADGRLSDRAFALTVATFVLLTPPIVTIFDVPVLVLGVPLLHVYCFAVWLAAIVAGAWLARRMEKSFAGSDEADGARGDDRGAP
jgi:hypothetical protein